MSKRIVIETASLLDRLYSNHLTVWYTLFALRGILDMPNRGNLDLDVGGDTLLFQTILKDHVMTYDIENTVSHLAKTSACRNYMRENFRITQNYCIDNNKLNILQEQQWYQFARILVNCISHNLVFDLSTVNKNRLPVSFNGVCIGPDDHGKHLNELFTAQLFLELGDVILLFAIQNKI